MNTTLSQLFYRFPKLTPTQKLVLCRRRIEKALGHLPYELLSVKCEAYYAIAHSFTFSVCFGDSLNPKEYWRYR